MYSARKSHPAPFGNSPQELSPYKKYAPSSNLVAGTPNSRTPSSKPKSLHSSRFLEANSSVKSVPLLNPSETKPQDLGVKLLARKPPPVYNPKISDSSFGLKPNPLQQTSSCPTLIPLEKVNQPKPPPKLFKHKKTTACLKKHAAFSLNAKGAFDRFIKSAKRNLTLDSSFSKTNSTPKKSKSPTTNKLTISYPKKIQSPDFDFIKTPKFEIEEIKPKVGLRRYASTSSNNLNPRIKPISNSDHNSAIKRSQTCAKRVLNLNQFTKSNKSKLKIVEPLKLVSIPENEEVVQKPPSFPSETENSQDELTLCGTDNKSYETIVGDVKDQPFTSQVFQPIEEIGLAMLPEIDGEEDSSPRPASASASFQDQDEKLHQVSPPWNSFPLNDHQGSPDPALIPLPSTPRSRFSILESSIHSITPTSNQDSTDTYKTKIIEKTIYTPSSRAPFSLKKPLIDSPSSTSNEYPRDCTEKRALIDQTSASPPSRFSRSSSYSQNSDLQEETIEEDITLTLMGCGSSYTPYNLEKFYSNLSSTTTTNTTHLSCTSDLETDEKKSQVSSGLDDEGELNQDCKEKEKEKEKIKIQKKSLHRFSNLLGLDKTDFDYCSDWCFDLMKSLSKVKV